ncbi:MAG: Holliday junction branch migration DNA helicase RuvB [Chlamydiae bacterium]|nr:Holliday junction branch migration DNA helicase RuvB [Chlamydiota bacterium]
MKNNYTQSTWTKPDPTYELTLRPQYLADFMGQDSLKERLKIVIGASKKRKIPLGHCLFHGPPGLGKTTLASVIANEMQSRLVVTSGPIIEKAGDLAGIMTTLEEGDILFIDEIHRLPRQIEEYLYPAMEDFSLDLMLDSGPQARSVQVKLNPFTLIGATTRMGLLSSPLRSRFGFHCRLDFYTPDLLKKIILRSTQLLGCPLSEEAAYDIGKRSRGTPRIANNLLRWVRDFAEVHGIAPVDLMTTHQALKMLDIDEKGLDEMDKKILTTIIDHHEGGPVGVKTLAAALGEEDTTLVEVYEPYLIMLGLLRITLRGREATKLAFEHFNRPYPFSDVKGDIL